MIKLIEELYYTSRLSKTPFAYSRRAFFFACTKTLGGKYEESLELLKEAREIEKDITGWYVGVRLLHVINFIELGKYEAADRQIEKMGRQLSHKDADNIFRERDLTILKILLKLMKHGYNFKKVLTENMPYFDLLESSDLDVIWNINGYELIIFHEWFRSKAMSRPYDHFAAVEAEKKRFLARQKMMKK
ncbi:MAG: hypothetical protein NT126_09985 [Bacteroidetes bacterium]|nr:hypothetical protein [Bacteroidota bacterium]